MGKTITDNTGTYTSQDVKTVTGINEGTLQHWLARGGELKLKKQNPGSGKPRQYTPAEVFRICLIKKLTDLAFPLAPAFAFAGAVAQLVDQYAPGFEDQIASGYSHRVYLMNSAATADLSGAWFQKHNASLICCGDYSAIWVMGLPGSSTVSAVRDTFGGEAVIDINIGDLWPRTLRALGGCIGVRTALKIGS